MQFGIPSVSLQLAKILGVKWHLLELLFLQCLLMQKLTLKCNQSKITNKQDKNIVCTCSRWSFLSQVFLWKEAKRLLLFLFWYSGKWQLDLKYEREMSFAVPPWCTKNISAGEDRPLLSEWGNSINSQHLIALWYCLADGSRRRHSRKKDFFWRIRWQS